MIRPFTVLLALLFASCAPAFAEIVKVGSKNFTEQFIVAEIYALALEREGFTVERRLNLGATLVAHEALRAGEIDLYPEYTGTGLLAVMKAPSETDPDQVLAKVRAYYEANFGLTWLTPSRINNGNAVVVRQDAAAKYGLRTLSDLASAAPRLRLGGGSEFFDRYDGVPGLKAVYGIEFGESRQFAALRLRYGALAHDQVDVTNGFTTDWQITADGFVALTDDKHLFPPYYLAPVIRRAIAGNSRIVAALDRVNARLDTDTMRELNRQVEVDKQEPRKVAAAFLDGRQPTATRGAGTSWILANPDTLLTALGQHLLIVAKALLASLAIALPLGIWAARRPGAEAPILLATGLLYTVPTLALFALLVPVFGLGETPTLVAIVLYSLLILTRNVVVGLRTVPPDVLEAADAMGFGRWRRLLAVELPLAAPVIMAGIRLTVMTQIAVATVGAFIGAGGLGDVIFQGITQDIGEKVVAGAVLASLLAIAADEILRRIENRLRLATGMAAA